MPLTDRDVNTPPDLLRNKRHSLQSNRNLPCARLNDENSPRPATKTTPPTSRILAPTKSSAAKAAAPSHTSHSIQSTPQSLLHSKLPRRTPPPGATSAGFKFTRRGAEQMAAHEKFTDAASELSRLRAETSTPCPSASVCAHHTAHCSPCMLTCTQSTMHDTAGTSIMNKPLHADKPLPSRPIASFINAMSPSKDSRSLLDASEQPLTIAVGGSAHDWPSLTPRSVSAGTAVSQTSNNSGDSRKTSASTGVLQAATTVSSAAASGASQPKTLKNHVYANAKSGQAWNGSSTHIDHDGNDGLASYQFTTPSQQPVLTHKASDLQCISKDEGTATVCGADCDQDASLDNKDNATATDKSRLLSPSPASFSRLRPTSLSHARSVPSPLPTSGSAAPLKPTRAQKTASRIPIPDVKKATLVDIKSRRSSGTVTPKSDHSNGPAFGRGRLDAPEALKILDQGLKRRQLNRSNTNGSTATSTTTSTRVNNTTTAPVHAYDRASSPEGTVGQSSSDEEEVVTPTYRPVYPAANTFTSSNGLPRSHSFYDDHQLRLYDDGVSVLGKAPPSNSPFTRPLQTIPSQCAFSAASIRRTPPVPSSAHQRMSSDFASMMKRFSDLQSAHADHTASLIGRREPVPDSTRFSLIDLLNEYEREDDRLSKEGCAALDEDTREHITMTLSALEGKGSPPDTDVDNETLLNMFGHLKRGLEKVPTKTSLLENAAAAQKFLEQPASVPEPLQVQGKAVPHSQSRTSSRAYSAKPPFPPVESKESKWSDSTTSDKGVPPNSYSSAPRNNQVSPSPATLPNAPKRTAPEPPRSIGYPSRIPNKANALIGSGEQGVAIPSPSRRISSPTLGKRKPGSVKAARETLHQVKGGFARTTASAESKKAAKAPVSAARGLNTVEEGRRGRVPSAEKPTSKSDSIGVPKV